MGLIFEAFMIYSSIPAAQAVVFHCKERGIEQVVISPGSRNAPLTLGFTADPFFTCYSIVDERSAGFFALGLAQQSKKPVALVCTSGSALLNYYPAIAEAHYSDIPLVVISADRPSYKIDIGDGQTIRQEGVLDVHLEHSVNLEQDLTHATETIALLAPEKLPASDNLLMVQRALQKANDSLLNEVLQTATERRAPVHINVPMEEPLYEKVTELSGEFRVHINNTKPNFPKDQVKKLAEEWGNSKRKMVLVGVSDPGVLAAEQLEFLGQDPSVIVFTETTSNLHHPEFFPSIDSIVAPAELAEDPDKLFKDLKPDLLLTFGGMIVSKKIKAFLRKYRPAHHYHIDPKKAYDTFYAKPEHIPARAREVLSELSKLTKPLASTYRSRWQEVRSIYEKKREEYLAGLPFSDFTVYSKVLKTLKEGYMVQLSNSSTVRYAQLFDMRPTNPVYCNRGTSGIEGSTSTAVGAAENYSGGTVLLTGDLSFLYDSNGLWNDYIRRDFRIIIINNGGGGIFRILPGKEDSQNFERYFETTHDLDIQNLASLHGFEYRKAADMDALERALSDFYEETEKPIILDIHTPRKANDRILLEYFDFIS